MPVMHPLISLLKYAYHGSDIPVTDLDDANQIDWIVETGLGPLLHYAISKNPAPLSAEITQKLLSSALGSQFIADAQHEALEEIIKCSGNFTTPITLLKGMSISSEYYPVPYTRVMRDIDILVAPEDLKEAEASLFDLGYKQESKLPADFYSNHQHSMPFYDSRNDVWVEVHVKLFGDARPQAAISAFDSMNIQKETVPSKFNGLQVCRLSLELQLAYLAVHWAQRFDPLGGLNVFFDILYLLRNEYENVDWDRFKPWLADPLLSTSVYLCFRFLQKYEICDLEEEVLDHIVKTHPSLSGIRRALFFRIVDDFYLRGKPFNRVLTSHNLSVLWDSLVYTTNRPVTRHILWNIIFPPGNPDRYTLSYHWKRLSSMINR